MLTIFDAQTAASKKGKPSTMNVDTKGRVSFSVGACMLLSLSAKTKLAFAFDDKDRGIAYFYPSEKGLSLFQYATSKKSLRHIIYSRPLADALRRHFGIKYNFSLRITDKKVKINNIDMWFIIKRND